MTEDEKALNPSPPGEEFSKEAEPENNTKPAAQSPNIYITAENVENVNAASGDVIDKTVYIQGEQGDDNDEHDSPVLSCDPTISLDKVPSNFILSHPQAELDGYMKQWKENRFILLGGLSEEIISTTAAQLLERPEFDSYDKRLLTFDGSYTKYSDAGFDIFTRLPGKKRIVLIDIKNQCRFFKSIFIGRQYAGTIKKRLEENEILMIALLDAQLLDLIEENMRSGSFFFTYWKIDFLPHMLKKYFLDRAGELETEILKQRQYGLWGKKIEDRDFYDQIKEELERGTDSFEERVKKNMDYDPSTDESHDNVYRELEARRVFKDEEPLKTVFFVGTFFSKLPPLEFHWLVRILLEGKSITRKRKTMIKSGRSPGKMVETEEEIKAAEVWDKAADAILKDCHLKAVSIENVHYYIDFSQPYLRKDMEKYFMGHHSIFIKQQFLMLQNSGILFSTGISFQISDNIIQLAVKMAAMDSLYHGSEWLREFILQIKSRYGIIDKRPGYPFESITQFLEKEENKIIRKCFYSRVSELIREMLEHDQLKEVVESFLNNTLAAGAYGIALNIVLEIGKWTLSSQYSRFNMFYWLKCLLDQGPDEVKKEIYGAILQIAIDQDSAVYDVLEAIREWLPPVEKEWRRLTPSNKYALSLIVHYCSGTVAQVEKKDYGVWPSKYPLFHNLDGNQPKQMERFENIVRWLLHPFIDSAVKEVNSYTHHTGQSTFEFHFHAYITTLLEEWGLILAGNDKKKANPGALELLESITRISISNADKTLQRKIMFWLSKKDVLYRELFKKKDSVRYDLIHMLYRLSKQMIYNAGEKKNG
jgi:hypothetical protein